jgi:chaperonin GroES
MLASANFVKRGVKNTMSKFKPLGDRVIVQLLESEDKTAGGIYLPDAAKKKPQEGTVISIGEGRMLDSGQRNSLTVKVGDRVLFSKYGGNEVTIDGKEYTILDEDQVYAIINN